MPTKRTKTPTKTAAALSTKRAKAKTTIKAKTAPKMGAKTKSAAQKLLAARGKTKTGVARRAAA